LGGCSEKVGLGGAAVPVPVRLTVCVVGLALSVNVSVSLLVPVEVGVNVTPTAHDPAGVIVLVPQVFETMANWLPTVRASLDITRLADPVLVTMNMNVALVVSTIWLP
jgi:hypothetical protein